MRKEKEEGNIYEAPKERTNEKKGRKGGIVEARKEKRKNGN